MKRTFLWILLITGITVMAIWSDLRYHWSSFTWYTVPFTSEQLAEKQKSIWEWLELLVIPFAIAISAAVFSFLERRNERGIAEKQREEDRRIADKRLSEERDIADKRLVEEREIADERAQDAALESYLAQMSTLLLETELAQVRTKAEPRNIARAWTLTILPRLNSSRKGFVIRFLHEAGLIRGDNPAISLDKADLRGMELYNTKLDTIDLSGADLSGASLRQCSLHRANLSRCNAWKADFGGANLASANLSEMEFNAPYNAPLESVFDAATFVDAVYTIYTKPPDNFDLGKAGARITYAKSE